MRIPGRPKKSPLDVNGRNAVLIARDIKSIYNNRETADLYACVSGNKVVFGLIQGVVGNASKDGKSRTPINTYLTVSLGRKPSVKLEGLASVAGANGHNVYARMKRDPEAKGIDIKKAFIDILSFEFSGATLDKRGFDARTTQALKKAMSSMDVAAPGVGGAFR